MKRSPNIVMIVIDSFRPDHLSMFGYEKQTDKNLKRIANESILFKNQFSVANGTAPALTTILSGLTPVRHGVIHQFPYTKPAEFDRADRISFWLPSFLQNSGYVTLGFDWLGEWFAKGFDYYKESEREMGLMFPPTGVTVDLAISKIEKSKRPFFAFLHLWDTHFPFPNTPFKGSGKDESDKILFELRNEKQKAYVTNRFKAIGLFTLKDITDKYDETIRIVDTEIGRLYDFLEKEKLLDDTIVIIVGDHGDVMNSHGIYFANCGLFDDAIRAPLIMKLPGFGKMETSEMVQNTDIVPTILDFIGEKEELDGTSLLTLIRYGKSVRNQILLVDAFANDVRAIRTGSKKLIVAKDNFCNVCKSSHHHGTEEYDLKNDPGEKMDVFSGESKLLDNELFEKS